MINVCFIFVSSFTKKEKVIMKKWCRFFYGGPLCCGKPMVKFAMYGGPAYWVCNKCGKNGGPA